MARTRRFLALLLVPAVAFMLMGAAELVDPDPIAVPAGLAAADVAKAITAGIVRRGWVVTKDDNGQIDATLNIRAHTAKVVIPYNTKEVAIRYVDSTELDYSEKKGKRYIHGNYVKWIRNMQADIQRELQTASAK
jgi:hypothetical protein